MTSWRATFLASLPIALIGILLIARGDNWYRPKRTVALAASVVPQPPRWISATQDLPLRKTHHTRWVADPKGTASQDAAAIALERQTFVPTSLPSPHRTGDVTEATGEANKGEETTPWPLTKDGVKSAIADRRNEILECYSEWLKVDPSLIGTVVATFTIKPAASGVTTIEDVRMRSTDVHHPFMTGCVARVLSELQFMAPDSHSVPVTYPLVFSRDEQALATVALAAP